MLHTIQQEQFSQQIRVVNIILLCQFKNITTRMSHLSIITQEITAISLNNNNYPKWNPSYFTKTKSRTQLQFLISNYPQQRNYKQIHKMCIPELLVCKNGGEVGVEPCGGFSAWVEKNLATKPLLLWNAQTLEFVFFNVALTTLPIFNNKP